MLQQEDIEDIRTSLNAQLEDLLGSASHMVAEMLFNGEKLIDEIDQATFESGRSMSLRIKDRESRLIYKIIETLKRIDEGTFGYCQICGREISLARLKVRPVTLHCIECKTKMESMERIRGD